MNKTKMVVFAKSEGYKILSYIPKLELKNIRNLTTLLHPIVEIGVPYVIEFDNGDSFLAIVFKDSIFELIHLNSQKVMFSKKNKTIISLSYQNWTKEIVKILENHNCIVKKVITFSADKKKVSLKQIETFDSIYNIEKGYSVYENDKKYYICSDNNFEKETIEINKLLVLNVTPE